jgi:hypothetical protein
MRRGTVAGAPGVPPAAMSRHDTEPFQLALFEGEFLQKFE